MKKNQKISSGKYTVNRKLVYIVLFFIALCIGIWYINWRAFYTVNYHGGKFALVWSYFLVLSEFYTFLIFTSFSMALIKKDDNPLPPDNTEFKSIVSYPSVDVYICTFNENLEVLTDTILGCLHIEYPNKKVYVLDDGRRAEVRDLANKLGCYYITRLSNKGYKAGNINNGMRQSDGELILVFDADHVPVSTFLKEVIHYFEDEKVALVQSPQHFFNPDPFQKNLALQKHLANEQDLFYRAIEPGLSNYGATICCGTNFVVRRSCVDEVGGFPEDTITEDSALGIMIESRGYKLLYYNKPLAAGRAPESFSDYLKQRTRWAKGNIQIFINFKNLRHIFKLKPAQLFFHFNGMLYFLYSFPRLVFLLSPVLFLIFGVVPVNVLVYQIVLFQTIYFMMKLYLALTTSGKYRQALITDVYESATALFMSYDIVRLLLMPSRVTKQKFDVTGKDTEAKKGFELKHFIPVFGMTLLLAAANLKGVYDLYNHALNPGAIAANIFWNTYNLIVMIYAVRTVIEKPELRKHIRIPTDVDTRMVNDKNMYVPVSVTNLSKGGALIKIMGRNINFNTFEDFLKERLFLQLPDRKDKAELNIIRYSVENQSVYFQVRFNFDDVSVKDTDDKMSFDKNLISVMYKNSLAWE